MTLIVLWWLSLNVAFVAGTLWATRHPVVILRFFVGRN